MAARIRFHRGLTNKLRTLAKRFGMDLGEEQAHLILNGATPLLGLPAEWLESARAAALESAALTMHDWELLRPDRDPYPPSFPAQVLSLARQMDTAEDPAAQRQLLAKLTDLCIAELDLEP
jgi:hypothetical protein